MKSIKTFFKEYWITLLIVLGMCFTYYIISQNGLISPLMFPKVDLIWKVFLENRNVQLTNVYASFTLLAPSILITLILALGIGLFMGINEKARKVLYPIVYGFSCVPSILLSPFVVLLSPNMWWASIIIIVYGCVWATLFATITGVQTIDKRYLDNAKTLELKGWKRFFKVVLPAASPSIISGFINSLRSSFVMLVYAEMYGAQYGLGFYVKRYSSLGIYENVWGGFIFMVIVLILVMSIFDRLKLHFTLDLIKEIVKNGISMERLSFRQGSFSCILNAYHSQSERHLVNGFF